MVTFIRYIEVNFTCALMDCVLYNEVLFHTFYCNFVRAEENRPSYRGLRYIEVPLWVGIIAVD